MSADVLARGIAVRAAAAVPRVPIALLINGQSNERGQVDPAETIGGVASATTYPQAYRSQRNPGFCLPIAPAVAKYGSPWFRLYDDLWDWGYDAAIIDNAYGSASFVYDFAGAVKSWTAGTFYRARRSAIPGSVDRGFTGDMIVAGGKLFLATTGINAAIMHAGPATLPWSPSVVAIDYTNIVGTAQSGTTQPDWSTVTSVGGTIADGTMAWTCLSLSTSYNGLGFATGQVMSEARLGFGFDPYGVIARGHELGAAVRSARYRIALFQNGQSDTSQTAVIYTAALQNMGGYYANRGWTVMPGLTVYTPTSTTAAYDTLSVGVANAVASLQASFPGQVFAGANLYQAMGSTGAMAAGGAYFAKDSTQDNVHVNARGAIEMGRLAGVAIKAVLPQMVR